MNKQHQGVIALLTAMLTLTACGPDEVVGQNDASGGNADIHGDGSVDALANKECVPACLPGYVCSQPAPDQAARCVIDPKRACAPCFNDATCLGGRCELVSGGGEAEGSFCMLPCDPETTPCSAGFACEPTTDGAHVCRPSTKTCTCHGGVIGLVRACDAGPEATCGGAQACKAEGWGVCEGVGVSDEVCDGLDNDCDGDTDGGTAPVGVCTHTTAFGTCGGVWRCDGSPGLRCDAAAASEELCDSADNDCDGLTDEPWRVGAFTISDDHCGVCNNSCAGVFAFATGICTPSTSPPHCVIGGCNPGYRLNGAADGSSAQACAPIPPDPCGACATTADCALGMACVLVAPDSGVGGASHCAPSCGGGCPAGFACGATAEGERCSPVAGACSCTAAQVGVSRACTNDNAFGACIGSQQCGDAGWSTCGGKVPAADACNGIDDDCDGQTDEASAAKSACSATNAFGACPGLIGCFGGAGEICLAKAPAEDVCNGVDDDCDGDTDKGFLDPATKLYLHAKHCGACSKPCPTAFGPHAFAVCIAQAGVPTCTMGCDAGFFDVDGQEWNGCECLKKSDDDVPDGSDANCDGVDGNAAKAVFVATIGSDAFPGTREKPMRTIAKAVEKAVASGKRDVYVAGGSYSGDVVLALGIQIYGGFSKSYALRDFKTYETVVLGAGNASNDAIAVRCEGLDSFAAAGSVAPSRFDGFTVIGADASAPGASSYALWSGACDAAVTLTHLRLFAGDGADAISVANGSDGNLGKPGVAGKPAKDIGHTVCKSSDHLAGGPAGLGICDAKSVAGGVGGVAVCPDFDEGSKPPVCPEYATAKQGAAPGENGADGAGINNSGGKGGSAGSDSYIDPYDGVTTQCLDVIEGCIKCGGTGKKRSGSTGSDGSDGADAVGSKANEAIGSAVAGRFLPPVTPSGGDGSHGGGGGGGGAAGGVEVVGCKQYAGNSDIGGSGGGGGAGGCGGTGGGGGHGGGGGFALWVVTSSATGPAIDRAPTMSDIELQGGTGGRGGNGGAGGLGAYGGFGGHGGLSDNGGSLTFCTSKGGDGGAGGNGGHGGGGGGGRGGPAWMLTMVQLPKVARDRVNDAVTFKSAGKGGNGGLGGSSAGTAGQAGLLGNAATIRTF